MATIKPWHILAQTNVDPGEGLLRMLPWLAIIFAVVLVGGVVVLIVRNRITRPTEDQPEPAGFTLADLRTLRDNGELTDAEFEAAKQKMLAKMKSSLDSRTAELRQKKGKGEMPEPRDPEGGEEAGPA